MNNIPKIIMLISGKRKCGKDYISETLLNKFGEANCHIIRISEPIKSHYAKAKNLNLSQLMSENSYKETYRLEMINWSDKMRQQDSGCFCRAACEKAPVKPIWIVSDIRRQTDIAWFTEVYAGVVRTVRIYADEEVRVGRGWEFKSGVDDVASECDLDNYTMWDLQIKNNNSKDLEQAVQDITNIVAEYPE